jgi:tetratricopeptide (TPR) repeat protein
MWLHRALETYAIPKRLHGHDTAFGPLGARLPPLFIDREELSASPDLAQSVSTALGEAASLIVICSPNAVKSRWVNEEIRAFTAMGRRDRIQCLIISGTANAARVKGADPDDECLPPALFESGGAEPLAADLRIDGKTSAKLKLIAGLTGLRYDDLRQRDQQRRIRRLAAAAVALGIGFLAMTALAVFAFISRAEAVAQRDIARQKTATAERTVDFVKSLFEVSDPSEARGETITAREVLDKGAARIESSLDNEPNVKADLMTTLAQVYLGLGSYKRGEAIISKSMQVPATDPGVKARRLMAMGASAYKQGDFEKAAGFYRQALPLAAADELSGTDLRPEILAAIGNAMSNAGDTSAGPSGMLEALRLDTANGGPDSIAVARDLEALGAYEQARDDLPAARRYYERAVAIRIARQGLSHPMVSEDLNELGSIAFFQHDSPAAEAYWRRALTSDELVLGRDHPDVAITLNNLARVMLEQRKFAAALPLVERAVAVTVRNRSADYDYLALLHANLGIARRGLGDLPGAERAFAEAVRVAEATGHRNLGPALTEMADVACAQARPDAGLSMLARAEGPTAKDYPDDPWRMAWLQNTRGACLLAKGDSAGGRALLLSSQKLIAERWEPQSLYGHIAAQRLAMSR